jgi:hypothetical protein
VTDRPRLLVLHTLRLRSVAPLELVATRLSLDAASVRHELDEATRLGWVRSRSGALAGYSLTVEGRVEAERLLAEELRSRGSRAQVEARYADFLPLNRELLAICTDWQVMTVDGAEVVNDHADPERDARVLARLDRLHAEATPLTGLLAAALERFEGYGSRLAAAHARIRAGETEWLTRPTIDSYHTVWFELHEDLLATLGRRRSDERPGPAGNRGDAASRSPQRQSGPERQSNAAGARDPERI